MNIIQSSYYDGKTLEQIKIINNWYPEYVKENDDVESINTIYSIVRWRVLTIVQSIEEEW